MKAVRLLHTGCLWLQHRTICAISQKCLPPLNRYEPPHKFLNVEHKKPKHQHSCCMQFSSGINSSEQQPLSATEQIANLNEDEKARLEKLQVEVEIMRAYGHRVPDVVTDEMWLDILQSCKTVTAVQRCLEFYYLKCFYKKKREDTRQERQDTHLKRRAVLREKVLKEGFTNTIHLHIRSSTMKMHYDNNTYHAMVHGPTVVFDLSLGDRMDRSELAYLSKQLMFMYGMNRIHAEPLHVHLCGLKKDTQQYKILYQRMPEFDRLSWSVSEESYLDLYPKEKLVYLSPNGKDTLQEYNDDDIYIIGGLVDKRKIEPVTYTKAKTEGIRCVQLPLDKYLSWALGSKCLTLDQVAAILRDFRVTRNWKQAFQHVPSRKLRKPAT